MNEQNTFFQSEPPCGTYTIAAKLYHLVEAEELRRLYLLEGALLERERAQSLREGPAGAVNREESEGGEE